MNYARDSMKDRVQRLWYFITSPNYSRTLGVLAFLVVALTIPLTLTILNQEQDIRQQAAGGCDGTNFCMWFDAGDGSETGKVGQDFYIFVVGNEPDSNPVLKFGTNGNNDPSKLNSKISSLSPTNYYSGFTCGQPEYQHCWKFRIPGDTITVSGQHDVYFLNQPNGTPRVGKGFNVQGIPPSPTPTPTLTPTPTTPVVLTEPPNPCENKLYSVSGNVIDMNGNGIPNAVVCLDPVGNCSHSNVTKKATTVTNGSYAITNIIPGGLGHTIYLDPASLPTGATIRSLNSVRIDGGTCENVNAYFQVALDSQGGTPTVSPSTQPSLTPSVTVTTPPNGALISFTVKLQQLGTGPLENPDPKTKMRNGTLCVYKESVNPTGDKDCAKGSKASTILTYGNGVFTSPVGGAGLGAFVPTPGEKYLIFLSTPNYLRKKLTPEPITLTSGTTPNVISSTQTLQVGDVNRNNKIDSGDYTEYVRCFKAKHQQKRDTEECITIGDLNDDGHVDTVLDFLDYRALVRFFKYEDGE